jgi:large subunit ribosomal protein L10
VKLGRADREKQIQELNELFSGLDMAVLADYRGMTVEELTVFRSRLREVEAGFRVVKNTLSIRAADGTPLEIVKNHFTGPVAVLHTASDPVGPAKVLVEFMKSSEHLKPAAGVLSGKLMDLDDVKRLASLPDMETMLAQAFASLNAPATNFVRTLSEIPASLVRLMGAIGRSKEAA